MAEGVDKLIEIAFADSRFEEAYYYSSTGAVLARKFEDQKRLERFETLSENLKEVKVIAQQSAEADAKLAADPGDPEANLLRGNFTFLIQDDLGAATKYWEKSSSEESKKIAQLENAVDAPNGDQLLELATCWAKLGEHRKTFADTQFCFQAKELCERAAKKLSGVSKIKAKTLARELGESLEGKSPFREIAASPLGFKPTVSTFLDSGLEITSARFGSRGKFADVTDTVIQKLKDGERFRVLAKVFGVDPDVGWNKSVQITYNIDGETFKPWFRRNAPIDEEILIKKADSLRAAKR